MNVIFTDIDGCLFPIHPKIVEWSPSCVDIYNRVVKDFALDTVVSSDWRLWKTLEQLQEIFKVRNCNANIVGVTIDMNEHWHRGQEIIEYLIAHGDINKYVVIDDNTQGMEDYINPSKIIKCNSWEGLTEESYNLIKTSLNNQ